MPRKLSLNGKLTAPVIEANAGAGSNALNIFIFGEIGWWWTINKDYLVMLLKGRTYDHINLIISSFGGDVIEALVIRDLLKSYPAPVTAYLTGVCASAATVVSDAADTIVMSRQCLYMIHRASTVAGGNAQDFRHAADVLEDVDAILADIYRRRTKMDVADVTALMNQETWMGPDEALALGFVDEVVDDLGIDFEVTAEKSQFLNEAIIFDNAKSVYGQAVTKCITNNFKQLTPVSAAGFKIQNNFSMNAIFAKFVAALVAAGFIAKDKEQDAAAIAGSIDLPETISNLVKDEVAKLQAAATPTPTVAEQVKAMTDAERAELGKLFNVTLPLPAPVAVEESEVEKKIKALTQELADLKAGTGSKKPTNGAAGIEGDGGKEEKTFVEKEGEKFYLSAWNDGAIDAKTYQNLTGQMPPKKKAA